VGAQALVFRRGDCWKYEEHGVRDIEHTEHPAAYARHAGGRRREGVGRRRADPHYYEREGLIPPPPRSETGYRLYSPQLVERIAFVRKAQALGLPLAEIKDVLRLAEQGTSPCGRVQAALAGKLAEVDRRLQALQNFRDDLAALVARGADPSRAESRAQICAIVEDAPVPGAADVTAVPLARRR
jgi:DNA-binding transcriptional MerR regulator